MALLGFRDDEVSLSTSKTMVPASNEANNTLLSIACTRGNAFRGLVFTVLQCIDVHSNYYAKLKRITSMSKQRGSERC